ncbi:MAG: OmpW family outer membrane protein [Bacteroidota bacterium]|nr:OmpW family outer membrane protein [Bacteroidota bacterium]
MNKRIAHLFLLLILFVGNVHSGDYKSSIFLKGLYITSSKIYLYPDASDFILRSKYLPIENIYGGGVDFRVNLSSAKIQLGLSVDFISKAQKNDLQKTEDGFTAIPVEISGYFYIPITNSDISIFMGTGAGLYFGERKYSLNNQQAILIDKKFGFGIHVLGGIDYSVYENFILRSQLKFRDLYFRTTNQFVASDIDEKPFVSQVNVDGMIVELGIVFTF